MNNICTFQVIGSSTLYFAFDPAQAMIDYLVQKATFIPGRVILRSEQYVIDCLEVTSGYIYLPGLCNPETLGAISSEIRTQLQDDQLAAVSIVEVLDSQEIGTGVIIVSVAFAVQPSDVSSRFVHEIGKAIQDALDKVLGKEETLPIGI